jgi:glutamate/tyrosine decarboxylase-like PLP-dependent enzyme
LAADMIRERPNLTLLREPTLSNVLFRREGWQPDDYARWSHDLLMQQKAFVEPTRWDGEIVGRLSLLHPATTVEMIDDVLAAMQ